jgi:hypothetical protein
MFMTALVPKSRRLFGPGGGHSRVIRVARSQGISRAPRRRWLASFGGTGLPENLRNKLNILLTKSEVSQLMAALGNRAGEAAAAPATRPTKLQVCDAPCEEPHPLATIVPALSAGTRSRRAVCLLVVLSCPIGLVHCVVEWSADAESVSVYIIYLCSCVATFFRGCYR